MHKHKRVRAFFISRRLSIEGTYACICVTLDCATYACVFPVAHCVAALYLPIYKYAHTHVRTRAHAPNSRV